MPRHIALLRGINVVGRNIVAMADLRQMLASIGFTEAQTLLQSGNCLFECGSTTGAKLEALLEAEMKKRLGSGVDYIVRTLAEWEAVISVNPFTKEAESDPSHLLVMFFKQAPKAPDVKALEAAIKGRERIRWFGRELYITYPDGIGRSKFTHTLIERTLGIRGTGRNWNTVLKLAAIARKSKCENERQAAKTPGKSAKKRKNLAT